MHVRGPDQDGVGVSEFGGNFIAVARQAVESFRRNGIERLDPEAHQPYRRSKSRMKSTSATTPSIGIALYRLARMPPTAR